MLLDRLAILLPSVSVVVTSVLLVLARTHYLRVVCPPHLVNAVTFLTSGGLNDVILAVLCNLCSKRSKGHRRKSLKSKSSRKWCALGGDLRTLGPIDLPNWMQSSNNSG
jgi:hypothetical protein